MQAKGKIKMMTLEELKKLELPVKLVCYDGYYESNIEDELTHLVSKLWIVKEMSEGKTSDAVDACRDDLLRIRAVFQRINTRKANEEIKTRDE